MPEDPDPNRRLLDAIREGVLLSDVVRKYVPELIEIGANFKARCPFHSDDKAVFVLNDERQRYYCFGCGADGDVIGFVMKIEGITWEAALAKVASRLDRGPA